MDELEPKQGGYGVKELIYLDLAHPTTVVIGKTLGTLLEFFTLFRLSIQFFNEKVKLNFAKRLNEYKKKLDDVPEEKRCEVPMGVGMPILEKLPYTTNDEIADMFTTLLASASNVDTTNVAHPSFADIIGHLSVDEARIIKYLKDKDEILYCNFRGILSDRNKFRTIIEYATTIPQEVKLDSSENITAYFENLVSQGILSKPTDSYIDDVAHYESIKEVYEFGKLKEQHVPNDFVDIEAHPGYFHITDLGKMFIKACIK